MIKFLNNNMNRKSVLHRKIKQGAILPKQKAFQKPSQTVELQNKFIVYCKDLNDSIEDIHINPLPTPAFVHFEASNTETPKFKFTPSLDRRVHRRALSDIHPKNSQFS